MSPRHVPPFRHVAVHPPVSGAESEQRGAILPSAQMQMLGLAMEKYYFKLLDIIIICCMRLYLDAPAGPGGPPAVLSTHRAQAEARAPLQPPARAALRVGAGDTDTIMDG